jgi:ligand-binding sensor domain-containing protein/signal transduction histidine kinase
MSLQENITRFIFIVFLQLTGLSVISQRQHIRFEHLGTDQGLSQSNVTCILRDSRGFMWFGTRDGLDKYDGYRFTVYKSDPLDIHSLSNNTVESLVEDQEGNIWVGTWGGGLNKFDRNKDRFFHFTHDKNDPNSISSDYIRNNAMIVDSTGDLWLGTNSGLNVLPKGGAVFGKFTYNKNNPKSLPGNDITAIMEGSRHFVWVGVDNGGLCLLNTATGVVTSYQHDPADTNTLSNNNVKVIFEDSRHWLWIGTHGGGMDLFDPAKGMFRHLRNIPHNGNSLSHDAVMEIKEGPGGNLWIGTENGGLNILDPRTDRWSHYMQDDIDNTSLNNNSIYSLCKDPYGNMWIGTFRGGVNLVSQDANQFTCYRHAASPFSLTNNSIFSIYEDESGNCWIATDGGGVNLFNRKTSSFTHFLHQAGNVKSICGNYVLKITQDAGMAYWIGTWGNGLTVFDPGRNAYSHFRNDPTDPSSISNNNCWAIYKDRHNDMWVGTKGGGLNLYNPHTRGFIRYQYDPNNPSTLNNNFVNAILEDSHGTFWIGTDGGGLNILDRKSGLITHFIHDDQKNSLSNNIVNCLFEDSHANLWIGTDVGLNEWDRKTNHFTTYSVAQGLPNNVIQGILQDKHGALWISTNKGLSRFEPGSGQFTNFTVADGLQSDEFKQGCCYSRSGFMYFGGVNGFNEFFPDSIKAHSYVPPLVITGFQIFNKDVAISGADTAVTPLKADISETREITVSYKNTVISFEFASLNYTIPEKKRYAYRLVGFDQKWNEIGIRRTATYTNLDPGEYILEIRGLNNDGSWAPQITTLRLRITPPFWLTWWFKLLSGLMIAGGVIAFYMIRMRAIKAQKKELEQRVVELDKAVAQGKFEIASDVLHDIGNAMVGFGSYLTRISRLQVPDQPENLEKLAVFFESRQPVMTSAIGDSKSAAIVKMLSGMAQIQKANQEEIGNSITEQFHIITHIQDILHIQRQYISGKELQERKPVNIRNIINDCMSMLSSSFEKSAITVSLDMPPELPLIKGDRTKLMQVFLQVFRNCLDAIEPDSTERTISIHACAKADQLVLEIRDTGRGFDKTISTRLFEHGFSTKISGAGMGLYNCKDIMESHEGAIQLISEGPARGTLVTIRFKA